MLALRAVAIWFVLLIGAFANGTFRELVISPRLGAPTAHAISCFLFSAIILSVAYATVEWIRPASPAEAMIVGLGWMTLTLVFEFGFGMLRGMTWPQMLADYNVMNGRLWVVVLFTTAVAPVVAARMRGMWAPIAVGLAPG